MSSGRDPNVVKSVEWNLKSSLTELHETIAPGHFRSSELSLRFPTPSFRGALLVGFAIASIHVKVCLERVVNIFKNITEAGSAGKFSRMETEFSAGKITLSCLSSLSSRSAGKQPVH